jgi:penicillin-binding protein-related factor A (putative recombinase)
MRYFKHLVYGGVFLVFQIASSQKTIHNFSYVVVPTQFYFQKQADQYQLNSLAKFLFEKEGVQFFLDTEKIPQVHFRQSKRSISSRICLSIVFLKTV